MWVTGVQTCALPISSGYTVLPKVPTSDRLVSAVSIDQLPLICACVPFLPFIISGRILLFSWIFWYSSLKAISFIYLFISPHVNESGLLPFHWKCLNLTACALSQVPLNINVKQADGLLILFFCAKSICMDELKRQCRRFPSWDFQYLLDDVLGVTFSQHIMLI